MLTFEILLNETLEHPLRSIPLKSILWDEDNTAEAAVFLIVVFDVKFSVSVLFRVIAVLLI